MLKVFYQLAFIVAIASFTVTPVFSFGGGGMSSFEASKPVATEKINALSVFVRQEGTEEKMEVPLFSEKYAQLPLAIVDEEPITLKEFSIELANMHGNMKASESPDSQSLAGLLDRLITVKLVKQEALNIGFDRTPRVQKQIEKFSLTTMIKQLLAEQVADILMTDADADELYQQMAIEAKLTTYLFPEKADAEAVLTGIGDGGNFIELAEELRTQKKAEKAEDPEYVRLTELLPAISSAVFSMETGAVSEIFKNEKGYFLFKLEDKRVYEDPDVRLAAASQLMQQKSKKMQTDYLDSLIDKYTTFDEEAEAALDFAKIAEENPSATGTEVFSRLSNDKRPLATISNGQETIVLTVADIAEKIKATMYHGTDKKIDGAALNITKEKSFRNSLLAIVGRIEAQAQGIDKSEIFVEQLENYKTQVLFDTFLAKAVVPGIKVPEEAAKEYYFNHLEEYASPLMLKMKSLPFTDDVAAREALKKLQEGSDFKWISANSNGLADPEQKNILSFDGFLLSETALPETLQKKVQGVKQGDIVYYAGPNNLSYILLVENAFPPKVKPYEEVRQEIGKIIYAQKIDEALKDWVIKLKEVYETKVFLVEG